MKLELIFEDPYENSEFIDDRMSVHTSDHIAKLKSNNGSGQYTLRINLTETAYSNFLAKRGGILGGLAIQKSSTITVDEQELIYRALVRRAAGTVLSKHDKKSNVWADIIPLKLSKFTYPHRSQIGGNIDHFIGKLFDHASEFGTDLHDDFVTLKASYDPSRQTQEIKIGAMKTLRVETSQERHDLNLQMYDNLLFFAGQFKTNPQMGLAFFDFSKLYYHSREVESQLDAEDADFTVELEGNETKNTGLVNIVGKNARFISIKGKVLIYTVASLINLTPGEEATTLESEGELEKRMELLGAATNPFLILRNLGNDPAQIIIEWID